MKIMTGHKIKTSVQSCKIMTGENVNYIAEHKNLTQSTSYNKSPSQARYLPVNINKKGMRDF